MIIDRPLSDHWFRTTFQECWPLRHEFTGIRIMLRTLIRMERKQREREQRLYDESFAYFNNAIDAQLDP